jgi:hypothetical protein
LEKIERKFYYSEQILDKDYYFKIFNNWQLKGYNIDEIINKRKV